MRDESLVTYTGVVMSCIRFEYSYRNFLEVRIKGDEKWRRVWKNYGMTTILVKTVKLTQDTNLCKTQKNEDLGTCLRRKYDLTERKG